MKTIDPIERALDAYFQLDTDQRAAFHVTVKYIESERNRIMQYPEPVPASRRGRPLGSKNRKQAQDEQVELVEKLFGNNGAVTEGL